MGRSASVAAPRAYAVDPAAVSQPERFKTGKTGKTGKTVRT